MIEPLPIITNKRGWFYLFISFCILFSLNLLFEYNKFLDFKSNEIYITNAAIINIYSKEKYKILKLHTKNFDFFTSTTKNNNFKKTDTINIFIVTKNIDFLSYLKGFYAPTFNIKKIKNKPNFINKISDFISSEHQDKNIAKLFNALFLGIPVNKHIQQVCSTFGISHLIAISGFHLGVLSFMFYWLVYIFYKPIQQKYFPYRNIKFDILILVSLILFIYLLLLGIIPSLLRAFIMFVFGIFFARSNIKILSFQTLFLVTIFIISLFPKLLFSLSLWFSIAGVFYIFLFLKYFNIFPKIIQFLLFNVWIYLAMNPISHMFFGTTSLNQFYSPLFTLGFSIFYPLELLLHIINYGDLLDKYISLWLYSSITFKHIYTPFWVFVAYIITSLFAIPCPKWFRTLNLAIIAFNLWLYFQL